ncbi:hypothetical protein [Streptomyces sp. LaPpAH-108]|uniref:hypothetical protein n=1 Tax=Streptomyces sp. LaPpAH-108 TaxID=1155714 RepID=UPI000D0A9B79|nr:hypothetical protein [Streptomyces sp. LaPpAH-108]
MEPRPRRRTARLLTSAVVLGVIAGTCAGYLVQAAREPGKLPSLSQPRLAQARGKAPEPLSAARDRQVKVNGDLRRLLLRKPAGARDSTEDEGTDGWLSLPAYAQDFTRPKVAFGLLVQGQFRRAATTGWLQGQRSSVIRLVQYRQEEDKSAAASAEEGHYWAERQARTRSWPVPGTGDGVSYVHDRPTAKYGVSLYEAEAHAWRGDIAMEIWIYDTKPIPASAIRDLAERQMERL